MTWYSKKGIKRSFSRNEAVDIHIYIYGQPHLLDLFIYLLMGNFLFLSLSISVNCVPSDT